MKRRFTLITVSLLLIIGISVSAFAIAGGKKPSVTSGSFQNLIADRIELTLENTEFTLKRASKDTETFTLTMYLTAKKTQADFYAVINSLTLTGIEYDSVVFTALDSNTENKTFTDLILTATDGESDVFKWQIDLTLKIAGNGTFTPVFRMEYTSGLTENSAVKKLMEIPLRITAE